jgi:NAD(P)-dependent dehydrogenase (short-subunit alcohol dehydrogenase family)
VVGIGPKNGEAFTRTFHRAGYRVAMVSRKTDLSGKIAAELGASDAKAYACDATSTSELTETFKKIRADLGAPEVLIYNAGSGAWKGFDETTPEELERAFRINASGLMTAAQAVLPEMRKAKRGCIIVVGATASLRGKPKTTAFAAGKAAQRSLTQSMARQFWPEGIHVSLLVIDGGIGLPGGSEGGRLLDPQDIAASALALTQQSPSAWSFEVDLRPKNETW